MTNEVNDEEKTDFRCFLWKLEFALFLKVNDFYTL